MTQEQSTPADPRKAFHAHLVSMGLQEPATPHCGGKYTSSHIEMMWEVWCAGIAWARTQSPTAPDLQSKY
jgi:hypothetical protein